MALKDKLRVRLTSDQRAQLERMIAAGRHAAAALVHACVLPKADADEGGPAWAAAAVAEALGCSAGTVARVRKRFAQGGLEAAVHRKKPTGRQYRKLEGAQEAKLVALACSAPPGGKGRWTLRMPAVRLVGPAVVDAVSDETVRRTLKKNSLKPWLGQRRVLPPKADAESACAMEAVPDACARPPDAMRPVACADEGGKQRVGEAREPLPVGVAGEGGLRVRAERDGQPVPGVRAAHGEAAGRGDGSEGGGRLRAAARVGRRRVGTPTRTGSRWRWTTSRPTSRRSCTRCLPPRRRGGSSGRLGSAYTPERGSWPDVAAVEPSALARQRLDRRIPDMDAPRREVAAREGDRNTAAVKVDRQFTTVDARTKLKRLYPVLQPGNSPVAEH